MPRNKDKDIIPNKTKNKVIRVSRPAGVTMLARSLKENNYMNTNEEDNNANTKKAIIPKLKQHIIHTWINNNMRLNGQLVNTIQLGHYLNLPELYIQKHMIQYLEKMGKFMESRDLASITRGLSSLCLKFASEIHAQVQDQVHTLVQSQGGKYVPFVSSCVNQAIGNLINSQEPMLKLLKALGGGEGTNVFIQHNTQNKEADKYLNTDDAIKLIANSTPSMMDDPSLADAYIAHLTLPNINARTQNLREIGLKHDGTQIANPSQLEVLKKAQMEDVGQHNIKPDKKKGKDRSHHDGRIPDTVFEEKDFIA